MSDKPLIVSLLIGLIVILVIGGVSLLVKMNSLSDLYKKGLAENMTQQKTIETFKEEKTMLNEEKTSLKEENGRLKDDVVKMSAQIGDLNKQLTQTQVQAQAQVQVQEQEIKENPEENLKQEVKEQSQEK